MSDPILGGILDGDLAYADLSTFIRAFKERYGASFADVAEVTATSIRAPTTLEGWPCMQTFAVTPTENVSLTVFDGPEDVQAMAYGFLSAVLDDAADRWPTIKSFRGAWTRGSVYAELTGLCTPSDPLMLVVRYARLGARHPMH